MKHPSLILLASLPVSILSSLIPSDARLHEYWPFLKSTRFDDKFSQNAQVLFQDYQDWVRGLATEQIIDLYDRTRIYDRDRAATLLSGIFAGKDDMVRLIKSLDSEYNLHSLPKDMVERIRTEVKNGNLDAALLKFTNNGLSRQKIIQSLCESGQISILSVPNNLLALIRCGIRFRFSEFVQLRELTFYHFRRVLPYLRTDSHGGHYTHLFQGLNLLCQSGRRNVVRSLIKMKSFESAILAEFDNFQRLCHITDVLFALAIEMFPARMTAALDDGFRSRCWNDLLAVWHLSNDDLKQLMNPVYQDNETHRFRVQAIHYLLGIIAVHSKITVGDVKAKIADNPRYFFRERIAKACFVRDMPSSWRESKALQVYDRYIS